MRVEDRYKDGLWPLLLQIPHQFYLLQSITPVYHVSLTTPSATMVKTRFVCVSDTHGYGTREAAFRLPKGDVLIHAGDITNKGTVEEFRNSAQWIREADFEVKIVIAGLFMSSCSSFTTANLSLLLTCLYGKSYGMELADMTDSKATMMLHWIRISTRATRNSSMERRSLIRMSALNLSLPGV